MSEFIDVIWIMKWHIVFVAGVFALVYAATRGEVIDALRKEENGE